MNKLSDSTICLEEYIFLCECMPNEFKIFKFSLIHQASKDGFLISSIKLRAGGKIKNLVIITTESRRRFSFFTPLSFSFRDDMKEKYKPDNLLASFIFSIDRKTKLSLKEEQKEKAIQDHSNYINYIIVADGHDICICNNSNLNNNHCYILTSYGTENFPFTKSSEEARSFMAVSHYFKTTEIEWYQIFP